MRTFSEVIRVGVEKDVAAYNPLLPLERACSNRCVVIGGGIAVGFRAEKMLRRDERGGEDRGIRREGFFHSPGDFRRRNHRQITHEFMSGLAP